MFMSDNLSAPVENVPLNVELVKKLFKLHSMFLTSNSSRDSNRSQKKKEVRKRNKNLEWIEK